jgi:hypothetical protein
MEKEFIPYEQALELKELGFESPYPIGGYQGGALFYYEKGKLYYDGRPMYSSDAHSGQLLAPLYQQAFRWFREKYGYNCFVTSSILDGKWYYFRENLNDREDDSEPELTPKFDTYEKAELACLKKLIEIVKNK